MRWLKLGQVFEPRGLGGWMRSHAQGPTALDRGDFLRVYFSSRPRRDVSLITYVDLDATHPEKVLRVEETPILGLGKPGTFDDHGTTPSCVLEVDGVVHLYYIGWSKRVTVPYDLAIGLALSHDGGATFQRAYEGPVVGRNRLEPYFSTAPFVVRKGTTWHMWYTSTVGWLETRPTREPVYLIKHAVSFDGHRWERPGETCFGQATADECLARPTVFGWDGRFHMLFSRRLASSFRIGESGAYRIGYASSPDLQTWSRDDALAGIDVSASGWDSLMVEYPYVIRGKRGLLLFYNGNDFGGSGFGVAQLDQG